MASKPPPTCTSQFQPKSTGVSTSRSRLTLNVNAAITAATATTVPTNAPVLVWRFASSGSRAICTPTVAGGGAPTRASPATRRARRRPTTVVRDGAFAVGRPDRTANAALISRRRMIAANPTAMTTPSTATPVSGSAARAGPVKASGASATPMAAAKAAPRVTLTATRNNAVAVS